MIDCGTAVPSLVIEQRTTTMKSPCRDPPLRTRQITRREYPRFSPAHPAHPDRIRRRTGKGSRAGGWPRVHPLLRFARMERNCGTRAPQQTKRCGRQREGPGKMCGSHRCFASRPTARLRVRRAAGLARRRGSIRNGRESSRGRSLLVMGLDQGPRIRTELKNRSLSAAGSVSENRKLRMMTWGGLMTICMTVSTSPERPRISAPGYP